MVAGMMPWLRYKFTNTFSCLIPVTILPYLFLPQMLGLVGTVHTVLDSGDLRISYPNNRSWTVNPAAVTKVHCVTICVCVRSFRDIVIIILSR